MKILADVPPTVAELLPMVDATHEVRWTAHGEDRRVRAHDGGAIAVAPDLATIAAAMEMRRG